VLPYPYHQNVPTPIVLPQHSAKVFRSLYRLARSNSHSAYTLPSSHTHKLRVGIVAKKVLSGKDQGKESKFKVHSSFPTKEGKDKKEPQKIEGACCDGE